MHMNVNLIFLIDSELSLQPPVKIYPSSPTFGLTVKVKIII